MKGGNSITSCWVVLVFKLAKIKKYYFSKALDIYFSWVMTASIKLMTQTIDWCLILNKLGRRRVKLCEKVMATLQC